MVRVWPIQQAQTTAAIKKAKPLEEKVLADVKTKVSEIETMLKSALENSTLSNITKEAEQAAHDVAKVQAMSRVSGPVPLLLWALHYITFLIGIKSTAVQPCMITRTWTKWFVVNCLNKRCHDSCGSKALFLFVFRSPRQFWPRPNIPKLYLLILTPI